MPLQFIKPPGPQSPVLYEALSPAERKSVRGRYVSDQKGLCWYCGASLLHPPAPKVAEKALDPQLFPDGFLKHRVHLHHDHGTGLTVGAVHAHCNGVLFQYEGK